MSAAITFHVAREASSSRFSQAACPRPRIATRRSARSAGCRRSDRGSSACRAEKVEVRTPADTAVHALRLAGAAMSGVNSNIARSRGRPASRRSSPCSGRRRGAARETSCRGRVVVPLHVQGDLGVEAPDMLVHEVVAVVSRNSSRVSGDLRLRRRDEVLPGAASGSSTSALGGCRRRRGRRCRRRSRAWRGASRRRGACRPLGVDAPALAPGVARPHEADVAAGTPAPS